jgi:hypothetical protein
VKGLVLAAVLAIGAVVALQGGDDTPQQSQASEWQQGVDRVDGVLREGLSKGTHHEIAVKADASATWLQGFGESVKEAAE